MNSYRKLSKNYLNYYKQFQIVNRKQPYFVQLKRIRTKVKALCLMWRQTP